MAESNPQKTVDEKSKDGKMRKFVVLDPSDVDPSDIDDTEEKAYFEKCRFIEQQQLFDVTRCYLPDFLSAVFARNFGDGDEEPFENKGCDRYLQWREEENNHLPHDSYAKSQFQYNPIAFFKTTKKRKTKKEGSDDDYESNSHKIILRDDWEGRDWLQTRRFALMAPVTYVGKTTANANARYLYAFAIDLDGVGLEQLQRLFDLMYKTYPTLNKPVPMCGLPYLPLPNIIVNSGHGLHLYYTMRYPLALYEENVKRLQAICRALYKVVTFPKSKKEGGDCGTTTQEKMQCLGIYHAFRLPETFTKTLKRTKSTGDYVGTGVPIQAWLTEANPYTLNDLLPYIWFSGDGVTYKSLTPAVVATLERGGRLLNPKRLTLEQARQKYGEEWYQNRDKPKGCYAVNRRLYDWWHTKMIDRDGVTEGHRYYCVMALAAFARKCNIPYDELEKDAYALVPLFDELTNEREPFEDHDVKVALKAYKNPDSVRWTPAMLSSWTDIPMKKTKRNRRKQSVHLGRIRTMQHFDDPEGKWREGNGRKIATLDNSKEAQLIKGWMDSYPNSKNKAACARDLGMSRTTVTKWWKAIVQEQEDAKKVLEAKIESIQESLEPIQPVYQGGYTVDELRRALEDPNSNIVKKTIVNMAKLFAAGSDYTVKGFSHEELLDAVTSGKWQEMGLDLSY